jgi:hypothetical protein
MICATRNRFGGTATTEVDGGERSAHFTSSITTTISIIQPQLAIIIHPPALDAPVVKDSAGMQFAGTDCLGSMTTTEVNCEQITAHFTWIVAAIVRIALPKLAQAIKAPTLDSPVIEQGTGMRSTSTNCLGGTTTTQVDGCQTATHFVSAITTSHFVAIAQLTDRVITPTLDGIVGEDGAGMHVARRNRDDFFDAT